jgi:hypothetical protein
MLVPELWHIAEIFLMIHIHDTLLFQKNKDQPLIHGFFRYSNWVRASQVLCLTSCQEFIVMIMLT